MGNYLITEQGIDTLADMKDRLDAIAPFTNQHLGRSNDSLADRTVAPIRGYLMQPISQGGSGLCAVVSRRPEYRSWKLDVAGIIFLEPTDTSRFQLRFTKNGNFWFDTAILSTTSTIQQILEAIHFGSATGASVPAFHRRSMTGALGNPCQATNLVINDDLYPELPDTYRMGDIIESKIGSWIFSIHRNALPAGVDYDIELKFTTALNPDDVPVQLDGPAVMTLEEIKDTPTGEHIVVTDVLDLPNPSPLRGGAKVVAIPMPDVGYGIVAAYPRDMFMEQVTP